MQNDGMYLDTLPYETFKKLKKEYVAHMLLVTAADLDRVGVRQAYSGPEEYVREHFKKLHNIEILRYRHNYKSLTTEHPQLGVVWMANDSVIVPGMEGWVLIGHNARYIEKTDG